MFKAIKLLFALSLLFVFNQLEAQKVKYKDIFTLLDAKDYGEGLPKLKAFLNDSKNTRHANANFQMGLYYEYIVDESHLIKDSVKVLNAADSAVYFLSLAKGIINEKELKKNDDYYQAYYRRDLRTGDFGIKLSDVHLDIEKKLQSLEAIVKYGNEIFDNLALVSEVNAFMHESYKSLISEYLAYKELLLMVDEEQLSMLKEIADKESDMKAAFDDVRRSVSRIGKKGYSPEMELKPIEKYGVDGLTRVDVYQNDIEAWEYGEWAYKTVKEIDKKINKLREELVVFNQKIKAEGESLKGLESIPYESLTHQIDEEIVSQLAELDENPLPIALFEILIRKNEFDFIINPERNKRIENEEDVDYQLEITDSIVHILNDIERDVNKLQEEYVLEGQRKYGPLIKGEYGGDFGILKLRKAYEEFLSESKDKWTTKNDLFFEKSNWGVSEDESDSVYLNIEKDTLYRYSAPQGYFSVATFKDDSANTFVVGLDIASKKGFCSMVANSRKIIWKETFNLGDFAYTNDLSGMKGKFALSKGGKLTAYIYNETATEGETDLLVINASQVGQVNWVNEIKANNEPLEIRFNDLKETVLYMMTEEEQDEALPEDIPYYVIDRTGKVR